MRRSPALARLGYALLAGALLAGCGNDEVRGASTAREIVADTAVSDLDGMSAEEIEQRAEAISPERAEELGVVDTTIHLPPEP